MAAQLRALPTARYRKEDIHVTTILDEDATRANILGTLQTLSKRIRPTDDFILFIAGHGELLQGGRYAILMHDYDGRTDEVDNFIGKQEIIGAHRIMTALQRIPALSQTIILDTCHAGGVMDSLITDLYNARMSTLARRMGMHIYASASSMERALDGHKGNGLFTHTLLEGLRNNLEADRDNDKKVSVVEWGRFAKEKTAAIAKTLNHKQDPTIINFGRDRVVYELR
uniref:Caspase domain-containing protein n=1 Tax=Candidatus Kentrum sp. TUN TaxID=2126343 RepID=A0A450ZCI4_9GAMM|nr:MAG: Caspase domain-containing protein [Candidatus Kentron sp. TUN]VFK51505.1 MAG: Caspase domain-containing protein [Candidatus Kentron sp. TUN]